MTIEAYVAELEAIIYAVLRQRPYGDDKRVAKICAIALVEAEMVRLERELDEPR